jgi:hypothetical protein
LAFDPEHKVHGILYKARVPSQALIGDPGLHLCPTVRQVRLRAARHSARAQHATGLESLSGCFKVLDDNFVAVRC